MKSWPAETRESQKQHALRHVQLLEFAISQCKNFRTAVQAGGNIGYWPLRMAKDFKKVITFEPEPITFVCLVENLIDVMNIEIRRQALGRKFGKCSIERRSLGSHVIIPGDNVEIIPLDCLQLDDLDLLQLDIEGYELFALIGAQETIQHCMPIIQLEIRDTHMAAFGIKEQEVEGFLFKRGYKEIRRIQNDRIYRHI